jgi:hypothetical protein
MYLETQFSVVGWVNQKTANFQLKTCPGNAPVGAARHVLQKALRSASDWACRVRAFPFRLAIKETMSENYVTCRCQHCKNGIEFDAANFQNNQNAICPHCGLETVLAVPSSETKTIKSKRKSASRFSPILVCCIGIGLLLFGNLTDKLSDTVMQQIYGAIEFCSGWIIVSIAVLINVLVTISKNQNKDL